MAGAWSPVRSSPAMASGWRLPDAGLCRFHWISSPSEQKEGVMAVRTADAEWKGNLNDGSGKMRFGSGAFEGAFSFQSRMGQGTGTNPEELVGAAIAGCFSMALSANLAGAG